MKKFILKTSLYTALVLITHLVCGFFADGSTDNFYSRFTSPQQASLIIGSSRAAQGIQPKKMNEILGQKGLYNFAFTVNNSSYGRVYTDAILKKVNKKSKNGLFILSVEPWTFVVEKSLGEWGTKIDDISILQKMHFFNSNPNYEYLYHYMNRGWGNVIVKRFENIILNSQREKVKNVSGSWTYLHKDGWLEINTSRDKEFFLKKREKTIEMYKSTLSKSIVSKFRIQEFEKLIKELKKYGNIYLVRLPVHKDLLGLDEEMMPNFNEKMMTLSKKHHTSFINMTVNPQKYTFTDGIHMYKSSGEVISKEIAHRIKEIEMNYSKL